MTDNTTTDITGNKKTIILIGVGIIGACALAGIFVPTARDYITGIVKAILGMVEVFGK